MAVKHKNLLVVPSKFPWNISNISMARFNAPTTGQLGTWAEKIEWQAGTVAYIIVHKAWKAPQIMDALNIMKSKKIKVIVLLPDIRDDHVEVSVLLSTAHSVHVVEDVDGINKIISRGAGGQGAKMDESKKKKEEDARKKSDEDAKKKEDAKKRDKAKKKDEDDARKNSDEAAKKKEDDKKKMDEEEARKKDEAKKKDEENKGLKRKHDEDEEKKANKKMKIEAVEERDGSPDDSDDDGIGDMSFWDF